ILRSQGHAPIDVQFAAPAFDPRYYNRRSEILFGAAEWVKKGGALPRLPELIGEMTAVTYTFKTGKFLAEPKDLVKQRIGRSPDLFDAFALTFGMVEMPSAMQQQIRSQGAGKALRDGDPYAMPEDRT